MVEYQRTASGSGKAARRRDGRCRSVAARSVLLAVAMLVGVSLAAGPAVAQGTADAPPAESPRRPNGILLPGELSPAEAPAAGAGSPAAPAANDPAAVAGAGGSPAAAGTDGAEGDSGGGPLVDATAVAGSITDADVQEAIQRGIAYLKSVQQADGSFKCTYDEWMPQGATALAALTMLHAGIGIEDKSLEAALTLLVKTESGCTYSISLIAQALAMLPRDKQSPAVRRKMAQIAALLMKQQLASGMWDYGDPVLKDWPQGGDNSNTQFAILALWQLVQSGIEVNIRTLRACESHFLESQTDLGGWAYMRSQVKLPERESMTAVGAASLFLLDDILHRLDEGVIKDGRAVGCGQLQRLDRPIDRAMDLAALDFREWIERYDRRMRNFPVLSKVDFRPGLYELYYLYSVERIAAASGRKHLCGINWYAQGADILLKFQHEEGSWGNHGQFGEPAAKSSSIINTCFAILFLAKGRVPIFYNKLRYDGDWNNDRRDVANLTRFASNMLEQPFNWQIIDIESDVSGWHDSPVLFLNGHKAPMFTDEQKARLKAFVAQGGLIFAEACCSHKAFAQGVEKLGHELWPERDWAHLPETHDLYTSKSHYELKGSSRPKLVGLTGADGFTFFILAAEDLSCTWHQNRVGKEEDPTAFRLGINVFRYALRGKPIRARLQRGAARTSTDAGTPTESSGEQHE